MNIELLKSQVGFVIGCLDGHWDNLVMANALICGCPKGD
jgi:hypothetical protein